MSNNTPDQIHDDKLGKVSGGNGATTMGELLGPNPFGGTITIDPEAKNKPIAPIDSELTKSIDQQTSIEAILEQMRKAAEQADNHP